MPDGNEVRRASTENAPADSPKIVTLSGEPPKAAILRWTQSRPKRWSKKPRLWPVKGSSGLLGKPKTGHTVSMPGLGVFFQRTYH